MAVGSAGTPAIGARHGAFHRAAALGMFSTMRPDALARSRRSSALGSRVPSSTRPRAREWPARWVSSVALASALVACSSLSFERNTATSGTFSSTGWSLTILSVDFPKGALLIARENASDANLANMVVESVTVVPYLGGFDWIFEFFCIRFARVTGTWGFTGQEYQSPESKP
jgi:hypothetical protein